jgi:hypothetical protein
MAHVLAGREGSLAMTEVLVGREGVLGRLTLNRPEALNALGPAMIRALAAALAAWKHDDEVTAVLLDGAGTRGLCAGGDIRFLYGDRGGHASAVLLAEEYRLDARITRYPKPYIALMDGLVMGGGVGVSAHGSVRVVTERTRLAMPEVAIGGRAGCGRGRAGGGRSRWRRQRRSRRRSSPTGRRPRRAPRPGRRSRRPRSRRAGGARAYCAHEPGGRGGEGRRRRGARAQVREEARFGKSSSTWRHGTDIRRHARSMERPLHLQPRRHRRGPAPKRDPTLDQ